MTSFKSFRRDKDRRRDDPSTHANVRPDTPSTATELGPQHMDALREIEDEGEPLTIAEEVAELTERGELDEAAERLSQLNKQSETHIAELQRMSMPQLIEEAQKDKLEEVTGLKRQDLIFRILKERVKLNGLMFGEGTLEILPDGFGFLRSPDYHYLSCPDDIYVSPSQIRRFGLRTGSTVVGPDSPAEGERALLRPAARRGDQLPGPEPGCRTRSASTT